jgi:YidC/Oxa1 family membrane protein insertase
LNEDPNIERRLILVFALSVIVLLISLPLLQRQQPKAPPAATIANAGGAASAPNGSSATQGVAPTAQPNGAANTAASAAPPPGPPAAVAPVAASSEQPVIVETPGAEVTFSNRGAVVTSWILRRYTDDFNRPLQLVATKLADKVGAPMSFWTSDEALRKTLNSALFQPSRTGVVHGDGTVEFRWSNGTISAVKEFTFEKDYLVHVRASVMQNGQPVRSELLWPGGFGDRSLPDHFGHEQFFTDVDDKSPDTVSPGKVVNLGTTQGAFTFTGIEDQYFALAFLPAQNAAETVTTFKTKYLPAEMGPHGKPVFTEPVETVGLAVGDGAGNDLTIFVGPKLVHTLAAVEPHLKDLVNFGWFGFIANGLFEWMNWMYVHWVHNYGWVIVLQTLILIMATVPLRIKAQKDQMKMARVQPKLKQITDRMRKLPPKDPRKQQLQMEQMKLFQQEGVNPLGGCLPIIPQWFLVYAYYRVLYGAIELRHAPWIGYIHDLSARDPYYVLPILIVVTQIAMMSVIPMGATGATSAVQMKMMKYFFPLFMGFIFRNLPAGLNVYYVTSNIVYLAQQLWLNKYYHSPTAQAEPKAVRAR